MPNALAGETSPYLLQHADNPVDWLPWGEPAFARARAEQKPIFLSIGYATCHWCHVMAHESFEDAEVAERLNASFVAIKVDREVRPDVDKVYMTYVQAMTGHGGWPLSAWLTPQLKPFYGGTYFPRGDRSGRPGFLSVLDAIAKAWSDDHAALLAEGDRVIEALRQHLGANAGTPATAAGPGPVAAAPEAALGERARAAYERCFQHFYESYDPAHGGFGGAPKFPRASTLNFLFRVAALQGPGSETGAEAVRLATETCRFMAQGGIHDHVGGGFHRYAVDEAWFVPHFEKMLYDQAQIAVNLLEAAQAAQDERFAWVARDTLDYALRDLRRPEGGFYSAEDADSAEPEAKTEADGHGGGRRAEGAFYLWRHPELQDALGSEAGLFAAHFGVAESGNVPPDLDRFSEFTGKNLLAQRQPLAATAAQAGLPAEEASNRLQACLERLRELRARRPRPLRDDKVITAWNGLMISALAKAHQVLETREPGPAPYREAARQTAAFIERELYDADRGRLYRSWRGARGAEPGFAEDYACLIQGLLDLHEADFDVRWLKWAEQLQGTMDELFWDEAAGGYFDSAAGDPSIVLRLKEDYDGAEPAPSSVAAQNLFRLAALLDPEGQGDARQRGRRCIDALSARWSAMPQALPQMLCAFEWALGEPVHIVLAGRLDGPQLQALAAVVHERLRPRLVLLAVDGGEAQRWLAQRAPWLAGMRPRDDGAALAFVCQNFTCAAPVATPGELRRLLNSG